MNGFVVYSSKVCLVLIYNLEIELVHLLYNTICSFVDTSKFVPQLKLKQEWVMINREKITHLASQGTVKLSLALDKQNMCVGLVKYVVSIVGNISEQH